MRRIHEPFIFAALCVALTAGFGYGAILVGALALGAPLGSWYSALVQAHGHAQLFGWVGFFILGMGLFFLPRLRGTTLRANERVPLAFLLLFGGILVRSIVQPLAGLQGTDSGEIMRVLLLASALLELAGMCVVVSMLAATLRAAAPLPPDAPAYPVLRFAVLAFVCLTLAFSFNLLGVWNAFTQKSNLLAPRYDQLIILLILYGVAVPMTIVFSIRNLPLFLRLALPPRGIWRTLALVYVVALLFRILPLLAAIADDALILSGRALRANFINLLLLDALAALGAILLNVCILIFVWNLDLLRRRPDAPPRLPFFASRFRDTVTRSSTRADPDPSRKPDQEHGGPKVRRRALRANYPDYGEYGRFELLIYSAFVWLVVAVILEVLRVVGGATNWIDVPLGAARHALMVGYITLLIFGMAVRMAPGFSGRRGVAYPDLVLWLCVFGNLAAFLRVFPTFFPQSEFALLLWGLSGIVGWCAGLVLAVVLVRTFRA